MFSFCKVASDPLFPDIPAWPSWYERALSSIRDGPERVFQAGIFASKRTSAVQLELSKGSHTDFLKRFLTSFREHKEYLNAHGDAENTKDNIGLPLDILKGGRDEERESKVKGPWQVSEECERSAYNW
jgi:hypothetical protein